MASIRNFVVTFAQIRGKIFKGQLPDGLNFDTDVDAFKGEYDQHVGDSGIHYTKESILLSQLASGLLSGDIDMDEIPFEVDMEQLNIDLSI